MNKNISLIMAVILAVLLFSKLNDPWRHISPSQIYTAIISTDGNIVPSRRQDFLVNVFKEINDSRVFENKISLEMQLSMPLVNGKTKNEILPLTIIQPGKYTCSYNFPENIDETAVNVSVFPEKRPDKIITQCNIPVKKEIAIIVAPPNNQIYTGDKIDFKLATVDKKSGQSLFKTPIRVKLTTPCGFTTLNRVVTTDSDGQTSFSTQIHKEAPEGFYTFYFQTDLNEQKISVYVRKKNDKNENSSYETTPVYLPTNEPQDNEGYIFNLNAEKNGLLVAYGCPDSDHRQIEIWQNGKLHYFSNLDLEGGTISIILQKPLLSGCPTLFKIWKIQDNQISSHEKVRYIPSQSKTKISDFLDEVNHEFQNTEKDKLAQALLRQGYIGCSNKITVENYTKIYSQSLKTITPNTINEIPFNYYDELLTENSIDNTVYQTKYDYQILDMDYVISGNVKLKIYLDTKSFLEDYIESLISKKQNLESILLEAICRINKYHYLDIPNKTIELEKIESLLIPISEVYNYLNTFPNLKKKYSPSILSVINKIKNIAFVPAELTFDLSNFNIDYDDSPMLQIKPNRCSLQSLQGLLQQNGSIKIINNQQSESQIIDLNKPYITIPDNTSSISNLRSLPLLVRIENN